jgi:hypothetical protein
VPEVPADLVIMSGELMDLIVASADWVSILPLVVEVVVRTTVPLLD